MRGPPSIELSPPGAHLRVSVELWPIVWVSIGGELLLSDVDILQSACDRVFAVDDRHAFLVDCSAIRSAPSAEVRRRLKRFEDGSQLVSAQKGIACAIVIDNALVRGAYTALRWISAQPVPNKAFATVVDAAGWCIDAIEREGLTVPEGAYALAGLERKVGAR